MNHSDLTKSESIPTTLPAFLRLHDLNQNEYITKLAKYIPQISKAESIQEIFSAMHGVVDCIESWKLISHEDFDGDVENLIDGCININDALQKKQYLEDENILPLLTINFEAFDEIESFIAFIRLMNSLIEGTATLNNASQKAKTTRSFNTTYHGFSWYCSIAENYTDYLGKSYGKYIFATQDEKLTRNQLIEPKIEAFNTVWERMGDSQPHNANKKWVYLEPFPTSIDELAHQFQISTIDDNQAISNKFLQSPEALFARFYMTKELFIKTCEKNASRIRKEKSIDPVKNAEKQEKFKNIQSMIDKQLKSIYQQFAAEPRESLPSNLVTLFNNAVNHFNHEKAILHKKNYKKDLVENIEDMKTLDHIINQETPDMETIKKEEPDNYSSISFRP